MVTLPKELKDDLIKNCSVPDGTVVINDEQVKSAGSGIQLPLLWHVVFRVCSSVDLKVSFSQVNVKTEPSRVEL